MNREKQLELIITKEESIKRQIDELKNILSYKIKIEEYRNFNNVFISSVRTFKEIISNLNLKPSKYGLYIGTDVEVEILTKIKDITKQVISFINDMLNIFKKYSEEIHICDKDDSKKYKYYQQIIDDYIKLLLYID